MSIIFTIMKHPSDTDLKFNMILRTQYGLGLGKISNKGINRTGNQIQLGLNLNLILL